MLHRQSHRDFTKPNFGVYYDASGQVMATYDITMSATDNTATLDEQHIYGASRLGMRKPGTLLYDNGPVSNPPQDVYQNTLGLTSYEITNYLGNVNAVITDRKTWNSTDLNYEAVVTMTADYYPGGQIMANRNTNFGDYKFGYNSMEMDNEVSGNGNSYTTEFRQYDPRLMRWKSLDPLMHSFPWMSPYVAFDNNPVVFTDPYGLSPGNGDTTPPGCEGEPEYNPNEGSEMYDNADWGGQNSIATGENKPGVGADMGSRKIPKVSPGGTPIHNPQPIYDEIGYNDEIKDRAVNYSNEQLLRDFKGLLNEFSWSSNSKKITQGLYDHFKENTGDDYSDWDLTNAVSNHPSTKRFEQDIANAFQKQVDEGKNYLDDPNFKIDLDGSIPRFNEFWDNFNGLRISVNQVWTYNIEVVSYKEVEGKWEAQIRLTLYDNFGLDINDMTQHGYAEEYPGFYSWYILQWARGYKPFVTVMHIPVFTMSGPLKK